MQVAPSNDVNTRQVMGRLQRYRDGLRPPPGSDIIGTVMAFTEHGFVLLALPKCASTTLEQALAPYASLVVDSPPARKHVGVSGFARTVAPVLAEQGHPPGSYEVVSMFRDPVEWLGSWWRYRTRLGETARNSTHALSFEEFARAYLAADPDAPTPNGRPAQFLTHQGRIGVDRIFAVERPEAWQSWFSAQVGAEVDYGRRNVSSASVTPELGERTRAELRAYFDPEYEIASRLASTGEWAGARDTALEVPLRPHKARKERRLRS